MPRSHQLVYALAGVAVVLFGVRLVTRAQGRVQPPSAAATPLSLSRGSGNGGRVVVHVAGAVVRPGVYRLRAGARADDAVRRAGGPLPRADLTQINLAQKLEDGRQVIVPLRAPATVGAAGPTGPAAGPINLNTATLEQLDTLDGIGPVTAQKILDYRAQQGGFSSVEDLDQVPGIGEATMAALRDKVTV